MTIALQPKLEQRIMQIARQQGQSVEALITECLMSAFFSDPPPTREEELLAQISVGLPEAFWQRLHELDAKAESHSLSDGEYQERLTLLSQRDGWHLDRVELVLELAQMRGQNPHTTLQQLGLK